MASLVDQVMVSLGKVHFISLEIKNLSGVDATDFSDLQKLFRSELNRRGLEITPDSAAEAQVQIVLSIGTEGYVWVAETRQKTVEQVSVINVPKEAINPIGELVPVLQETRVLQQPGAILDFAQVTGGGNKTVLLILDPDRLTVLEKSQQLWTMRDSFTFPPLLSRSRDLRGRLHLAEPGARSGSEQLSNSNRLTVFLGGASCEGFWHPKLALNCQQSDRADDAAVKEKKIPAGSIATSFSSASDITGTGERWLETRSDGTVELFDKSPDGAVATFSGWGDDIVSLTTKCSAAWQVLVSGPQDWMHSDRLQLYEIADNQALAVGRPLELSGPILALRESDNADSARVVWRDLQTGMYEASMVSITCSN